MFNKFSSYFFRQKTKIFTSGKTFFTNTSKRNILKYATLGSLATFSAFQISNNLQIPQSLNPENFPQIPSIQAEEIQLSRVMVGNVSDLQPGQMKEVQVGPDPKKDTVVIANVEGTIYCVGSKCSHFGAPMAQGMLFGERVFCPWHLASFSVITGQPDFGPVFKALPTYTVEIENGKIFVNVPKSSPSSSIDVGMVDFEKVGSCSNQRFVIVGAGPAGLSAAETLRQSGFTGKITMVNKEGHLPYDRTIISKYLYGAKADGLKVRDKDFFSANQIEIMNDEVVGLDAGNKKLNLKNSGNLSFDKVLIATGLRPKPHQSFPYKEGGNVFYVRGADDARNLQKFVDSNSEPKNVVVIGGGFIGVESASTTKQKFKNANVSLVTRSEIQSKSLGNRVGAIWRNLSEKNGVNFRLNSGVKSVSRNSEGNVTSVTLLNGDVLPADMVIVGVGSLPNTDFLKNTGLKIQSSGKLRVNSFLKVSKDVYAAGDVISFYSELSQMDVNSEHYSEAICQGSHAAWNMLTKMVPYKTIPFYWTRAFNKSLAVLGNPRADMDVVVRGKPEEFNFIAYYVGKTGRIEGAAGMGYNKELIAMNQAMRLNIPLLAQNVVDPEYNWESLYNQIVTSKAPCKCQRKCNNES